MKKVIVKLDDKYPYAIVRYTSDIFVKENIAVICVIDTKKEFEKETKRWDKQNEPDTMGSKYTILYIKKDKFSFDDE